MRPNSHHLETISSAHKFWLKACIFAWMLIIFLIFLILDNIIYTYVYNVAQATGSSWFDVFFIQSREWILQFFTATYLY